MKRWIVDDERDRFLRSSVAPLIAVCVALMGRDDVVARRDDGRVDVELMVGAFDPADDPQEYTRRLLMPVLAVLGVVAIGSTFLFAVGGILIELLVGPTRQPPTAFPVLVSVIVFCVAAMAEIAWYAVASWWLDFRKHEDVQSQPTRLRFAVPGRAALLPALLGSSLVSAAVAFRDWREHGHMGYIVAGGVGAVALPLLAVLLWRRAARVMKQGA